MSRLPPSLTARELREALEQFEGTPEDELPVFMVYNYGDYHNTPALEPIGAVQERHAMEEAYSRSGWGAAPEPGEDEDAPEDEDDIDEEDTPKVILLSQHERIPRGKYAV